MRRLRSFLLRVSGLFRTNRIEHDLRNEIDSNLQLHIDDNIRSGMSPEAARRAARLKFGSLDAAAEALRDRRSDPMLDSLARDTWFSLRILRKNPGFSVAAIATFAIGIGFNAALFTIVDAAVFRPLKVNRPDRLVDIYTNDRNGRPYATTSYPDYLDLKTRNDVFTDAFGYTPAMAALRVGEQSRLTAAEAVTGNYFRVLGVDARLGRTLLPEDDRPGASRVAMISYRFWKNAFAENPSAIGQQIRIGAKPYTIIGVAPAHFTGMLSVLLPEVWTPLAWIDDVEPIGLGAEDAPAPPAATLERRGNRFLLLKGRLKDGQTVQRASANLRVIMDVLAAENPQTNKDRRTTVLKTTDVRIHPEVSQPVQFAALGLMGFVGLVLLIACANVAGMLLARASRRQKELGIRQAIGASRSRLVQQLFIETMLLSLTGAICAVGFAWLLVRSAVAIPTPLGIPIGIDLQLDARVLAFTTALTILAGLAAGLAPALRATRVDLMTDLKDSLTTVRRGRRRWTLRDALVVTQIAVTLVLLVAAGLLARAASSAYTINLGFRPQGVASINLPLNVIGYDGPHARRFYNEALERVRALPAVVSAAQTWRPPLGQTFSQDSILLPGQDSMRPSNPIETTSISPDYFRTLGVPIREGRDIAASDTSTSPRVAIINEAMARRFWPNQSAIGQRFQMAESKLEYEIIGVSEDYKVRTIAEPPTPYIHFAVSQARSPWVILARTDGDAAVLASTIRRELLTLEPNLLFSEPGQTLQEQVDVALGPTNLAALSMSVFGAVAIVLTAVGLYGVIAFLVALRTPEIGVRLALGASPNGILRMVLHRSLVLTAMGLLLGMPLALGVGRLLSFALYGVTPFDPIAWIAALAVIVISALASSAAPAHRASRVDPMAALRCE